MLMMRLCLPLRRTCKSKYRAARNMEMDDLVDTGGP